jgi:hypothetical protein
MSSMSKAILLAFPLIFGVLYQRFTALAGVIMPTSSILIQVPSLFMVQRHSPQSSLQRAYALRSSPRTPYPAVLAYCQMFPLYITIAQYLLPHSLRFLNRPLSPSSPSSSRPSNRTRIAHLWVRSIRCSGMGYSSGSLCRCVGQGVWRKKLL